MTADYVLGIDYGEERVGVAIAHTVARLPHPLTTLKNDEKLILQLTGIIETEKVGSIVVGVPRNMDGTLSAQSKRCEAFIDVLKKQVDVPVYDTDETLSSIEAERRLGHTHRDKGVVDAEAATIILERYLGLEP